MRMIYVNQGTDKSAPVAIVVGPRCARLAGVVALPLSKTRRLDLEIVDQARSSQFRGSQNDERVISRGWGCRSSRRRTEM